MKTTIKECSGFPIKAKIRIDSPAELCDLLSRLNIQSSTVNSERTPYIFPADDVSTSDLWDRLDDVAFDLGLKNEKDTFIVST